MDPIGIQKTSPPTVLENKLCVILKFRGCSLSLNNITGSLICCWLLNSNGKTLQGQRKTMKTKLAFIIGLLFLKNIFTESFCMPGIKEERRVRRQQKVK